MLNPQYNHPTLEKFTRILALGALIVSIPMTGYMFGWAFTVETQTDPTPVQLPLWEDFVDEAWADQSIEGFKYKVFISDGVDGTDQFS